MRRDLKYRTGTGRVIRRGAFLAWIAALLLVLSVFLLPPVIARAEGETEDGSETVPSKMQKYSNRDYLIDAYDIHLVLKENHEMDITEKLTVWFHEPRHGIYRTIPLRNTVYRQDGTRNENRAKVSNIGVNESYETEREGSNCKIKIGDADVTVTGQKEYTISYTYALGKDPLQGKDEFYFNLVGSEWTNPIGNITFTIEMPKDFDEKLLGFTAGWVNKADSTGVSWTVDGRTIKGRYDGILEPGQALTVRVELPEGYFVGAGFENPLLDYICYGLPVLFLVISVFIWFKYGRDDMVVETVEFYPPNGINSLDAGYFYKGEVEGNDVTSLLVYLANQGYLRLEETEEKGFFKKKKTFRIVELKEYDGADENERTFMEGLFTGKKEEGKLRTVTAGQLYDRFYVTTNSIKSKERKKSDLLFEKGTGWKAALIMLMILITSVLICLPPILSYDFIASILVIVFPVFGFGFSFAVILAGKGKGRRKGKMKKGNLGAVLFGVFFGLGFGGAPLFYVIVPLLKENSFYMVGFFVGLACIAGMLICFVFMPKRTPYGIEMLGRLEGFRNFLEVAEKQQLEQLVMQDPQYFYRILPYTYVLGVSDKWIKKFEAINLQAPDWYYGSYYNVYDFGETMDRTMSTANRAMTSSPSESSGGGGSSGGGFSGGGSGGGGGGSW